MSEERANGAAETKDRILDAAETLLIERSYSGTSLRAVTRAAGVNLGAVHYHFGSKEGLLQAAVQRAVAPINQERLKRLDQLEARVEGGGPDVEEILRAFLAPVLADGALGNPRLGARLYGEPEALVKPILKQVYGEVVRRFKDAMARALPHVESEELAWRFHFTVGAMLHTLVFDAPLGLEPAPASHAQERLESLVRYAAAALRAGAPPEVGP